MINDLVPECRRIGASAKRLYDAETALHAAHQTHEDAWITAASDRLHEAVVEFAVARQLPAGACAVVEAPPEASIRDEGCDCERAERAP